MQQLCLIGGTSDENNKTTLCVLLMLALLCVGVPVAASAATIVDRGTCGEELTRTTVMTEMLSHTDEDNDGKCDACGGQMQGEGRCEYCGKVHDGAFGWLVRFFHRIFSLFKR